MRESGIPKWALSQIKQVTGSIYKDGRRAGFNPQAGRLAIGKNLFSEEESEFRLVISHEIGHAMDFMPYDGKVLATLSSHPDMAGVLNESQNAYDSGLYPDVLWYPLDSTDFPGAPDVVKRQEVFATIVSLYVDDKRLLQTNLPKSYQLLERVFNGHEKFRSEVAYADEQWTNYYTLSIANEGALSGYRFQPVRRGNDAGTDSGVQSRNSTDDRGSEPIGEGGLKDAKFSRTDQTDTP